MKQFVVAIGCVIGLAGCSGEPSVAYVQSEDFNPIPSLELRIEGNADSAVATISDRTHDYRFEGRLIAGERIGVAHVFEGKAVSGDIHPDVTFTIIDQSVGVPFYTCSECATWTENPAVSHLMLSRVREE